MSFRFSWEGSDFSSCTFVFVLVAEIWFRCGQVALGAAFGPFGASGELLSFAFSWQVVALVALFISMLLPITGGLFQISSKT